MQRASQCVLTALAAALSPALALADVEPAEIFTDHAVLQRQMPVPVWGKADPGEAVTVAIAGQTAQTTTDAQGQWKVTLKPMEAGGPHELTIRGENTITLQDVLVGEVWLASGQSNMVWKLDMCFRSDEAMDEALSNPRPRVRLRNGGQGFGGNDWKPYVIPPDTREKDISKWFGNMPGLPFFFARDLYEALEQDVPVGIICQSWGNSKEIAWMSRETLASDPDWKKNYLDEAEQDARSYKEKHGKALPDGWKPHYLYDRYIAPIVPYAFRGALWWQGQSGGVSHDRQAALIRSWREDFGHAFPFYIVGFINKDEGKYLPAAPGDTQTVYAGYRLKQQQLEDEMDEVYAVFIADLAYGGGYHPQEKEGAAARAVQRVLTETYDRDVPGVGPRIVSAQSIGGGKVRVTFDKPLSLAHGQQPHGFSLAESNYKFQHAHATLDGDHAVILRADRVDNPAWAALGYQGNVNEKGHWNLYLASDYTIPARMPYGEDGKKIDTKVGLPVRPFVAELPFHAND